MVDVYLYQFTPKNNCPERGFRGIKTVLGMMVNKDSDLAADTLGENDTCPFGRYGSYPIGISCLVAMSR